MINGDLKSFALPELFQAISLQQKTGILTVFRGAEVVTVSFLNGMVVFSDEFQRSEQERLGAVLLKAKLISPQQLMKAVEMQRESLQKLGHILVANGFLSHDQLRKALQIQVRETVFKLFRWAEGQFKFSEEPVAYDAALYVPMPCDVIVMEGVRRVDEWPLIKQQVESPLFIFDKTEAAEERVNQTASAPREEENLDDALSFMMDEVSLQHPAGGEVGQGLRLASSETIVFGLVDGRRTVQDLVDEGRIGEFETYKALYSLVSANLIRKTGEVSPAEAASLAQARPLPVRGILLATAAVAVLGLILAVNPLSPLRVWPAREAAARRIADISDKLKREKVRVALACYQLERGSYPSALEELVAASFLRPGDIVDTGGTEFSYLREQSGYSLRTSGPAARR